MGGGVAQESTEVWERNVKGGIHPGQYGEGGQKLKGAKLQLLLQTKKVQMWRTRRTGAGPFERVQPSNEKN